MSTLPKNGCFLTSKFSKHLSCWFDNTDWSMATILWQTLNRRVSFIHSSRCFFQNQQSHIKKVSNQFLKSKKQRIGFEKAKELYSVLSRYLNYFDLYYSVLIKKLARFTLFRNSEFSLEQNNWDFGVCMESNVRVGYDLSICLLVLW